MSLLLQPPELLDAIASLIRQPRDLLSVALASKALHDVVVPGHLDFREVCCDPSRTSLWKALAEHPGLAGRILSLDLQSEPISTLYSGAEVVVPTSLTTRSSDVEGSLHGESGNGLERPGEQRRTPVPRAVCCDFQNAQPNSFSL